PAIAALLNDPARPVREAAADLIEAIGGPQATEHLVRYALANLSDPNGPRGVGPGRYRLENLGAAALPTMVRAYSDAPPEMRLTLIHIAQRIGSPAARPMLEQALDDSDSLIGRAAAEALGSLGDPSAYEQLIQLLGSDNPHAGFGAITGLELLGNRAAIGPLEELLARGDTLVAAVTASPGAVPDTLHSAAAQAIHKLRGL
ncbi:HEAT repeat domain-containing protein, partial [Candidatus Gracilibacteria bacterium]|nr:HEAT repeat domain-containing protein [Candidatus Gracilibacteria bacterium]